MRETGEICHINERRLFLQVFTDKCMHSLMNTAFLWLTIQSNLSISYFLFSVKPFFWIKWHDWHLKVEDLDKPRLGDTACAWESCHLMHNTDELWGLECETSQPWIIWLIILHKMKKTPAALSHTSWRGMAWAGSLTTRQKLGCSPTPDRKPIEGWKDLQSHTHIKNTEQAL